MSAKTFEEWKEDAINNGLDLHCRAAWEAGQAASRAALLADRPEVAGLVDAIKMLSKVYEDGSRPLMEALDIDRVIATLESLAAQVAQRDEEIAKLKAHAEAMHAFIVKCDGEGLFYMPECAKSYRLDYPVTP